MRRRKPRQVLIDELDSLVQDQLVAAERIRAALLRLKALGQEGLEASTYALEQLDKIDRSDEREGT